MKSDVIGGARRLPGHRALVSGRPAARAAVPGIASGCRHASWMGAHGNAVVQAELAREGISRRIAAPPRDESG